MKVDYKVVLQCDAKLSDLKCYIQRASETS